MKYTEIEGDLIKLALEGRFDVICHGVNCFCTMGAGIAPKMAKIFGADKFSLEADKYRADLNKLGCIDFKPFHLKEGKVHKLGIDPENKTPNLFVVNCYTQYSYGKNHKDGVDKPLNYTALRLCMYKINQYFKGKHIGLPLIGCGLAGGDWETVKSIIQQELKDCKVTIVHFKN